MSETAPTTPQDKVERPLNKQEMRLFNRIYAGSILLHTDTLGWVKELGEDEVAALDDLRVAHAAKILKERPSFNTPAEIVNYIKGLRK